MIESLPFKVDIAENLRVIGPAGRAHMDFGHPGILRQRHRQTHRAGAARGLHPLEPPAHGCIRAENIRHQRIDKTDIAFRPQIAFGILRIDERLFRRLDRAEHRGGALAGAIDAHAKVNLVRAFVSGVEFDQRQQRIGRLGFESVQHGARLYSHVRMLQPTFALSDPNAWFLRAAKGAYAGSGHQAPRPQQAGP